MFIGLLLRGTNWTSRYVLMDNALQAFACEVHVDGFEGTVDAGMVEIIMVPGDNGPDEGGWNDNLIFVEDEFDIINKFDIKDFWLIASCLL